MTRPVQFTAMFFRKPNQDLNLRSPHSPAPQHKDHDDHSDQYYPDSIMCRQECLYGIFKISVSAPGLPAGAWRRLSGSAECCYINPFTIFCQVKLSMTPALFNKILSQSGIPEITSLMVFAIGGRIHGLSIILSIQVISSEKFFD